MPGETAIEWLRGRGIGRERLAGHIGEFLGANGFQVERVDNTEGAESIVRGDLRRMNPAVPEGGRRIEVRLLPTSGGCAVYWAAPIALSDGDRPRFDRFARELLQHIERSVSTGSHGTAKIARTPGVRMPWEVS